MFKQYTRDQKIKYYKKKLERLEQASKDAEKLLEELNAQSVHVEMRLAHIEGDQYQDWSERVTSEIQKLKA